MTQPPIRVGLLFDYPGEEGRRYFETGFPLGLEEVVATGRLPAPVELISRQAAGLPSGSAENVSRAFAELESEGALIVTGPSVSDNAVVIREDANRAQLPTLQWSGGEEARSEWMFHYQIGSLGDEPPLLAERLAERKLSRPAVIYDESIVGHRYLENFEAAAARFGIEIAAAAPIDSLAEDVHVTLGELRAKTPDSLVYFGVGAAARAVSLGLSALEWELPVLANSGLMFGYAMPDWRDGFRGWEYPDTISDDNQVRKALAVRAPDDASDPVVCGAYDVGRLVGEALARAPELTRAGVAEGLRQVKHLRAASGYDGTVMGFGVWDHAALKGRFLVLREWRDGRSVQVER